MTQWKPELGKLVIPRKLYWEQTHSPLSGLHPSQAQASLSPLRQPCSHLTETEEENLQNWKLMANMT